MTTTPTDATAARQATLVDRGRRVIRLECEALAEVGRRLDERFAQAVELIAGSTGRPRRRRRQVRDHREEDRGDVHVNGHAGDVPASRRQRAR